MRSTTFDMIGMSLMAIVTILSSGGILTWSYLKGNRRTHRRDTPERTRA